VLLCEVCVTFVLASWREGRPLEYDTAKSASKSGHRASKSTPHPIGIVLSTQASPTHPRTRAHTQTARVFLAAFPLAPLAYALHLRPASRGIIRGRCVGETNRAGWKEAQNPKPQPEQHETNEWLVNGPRQFLEQREPLAGELEFTGWVRGRTGGPKDRWVLDT
jgi:hypothetical protein